MMKDFFSQRDKAFSIRCALAAHDTAYIYRKIWQHYTVFVCEEVRSVVRVCGRVCIFVFKLQLA